MATPTPNQPTCVIETKPDKRYDPFSPNEYLANKWVESPVSPAIQAKSPVYIHNKILPNITAFKKSPILRLVPIFPPAIILAEKNANPSITTSIDINPFFSLCGIASSE